VSPTYGEQEISVWNAITPAPGITRCSCSISLATSNAVLCVPTTCTTRFCRAGSAIYARAQSDDLRTMYAGSMPISAIRPEPGPSRGGLSPRSSGIPENFIPASAHEPPGRLLSTTSVGRASNGSRSAKARSSGRDCRAERSPPTRCGSSFGNFLRTLPTPEPTDRLRQPRWRNGHDLLPCFRTGHCWKIPV
jgi:hypothetical protein